MNLLFLIVKGRVSIVLCLLFSQMGFVVAADTDPNSIFKEQCMRSNAYMVYYYTDVTYTRVWGSYKKQTSVQSKLVVNNKSGVDEYAFVNFDRSIVYSINSISIKTLKADGSEVILDSSLVLDHFKSDKIAGQINYPIPGAEPGDTIEVSYMYIEHPREYELGNFVNLYSGIPSLNTEYSVCTSPNLQINYKIYNGFPEPLVFANDTLVYCLFKMERIKGIVENQYTCLSCELPYAYYSIDKKGNNEPRTWKQVYNQEFNIVTQPVKLDYENASYYNKWKKKVIGDAVDSSKFYKLQLLLNDIYANYKIESLNAEELFKSSGYFLKEMHFDPISIRRLYRQLLEDLEIKYWAVFARSKHFGNIDPYYIRKGEYDHIFFAFENSEGSINFLYPHNLEYYFQINELPTSLYNARAVIARPSVTGKVKSSDKYINYDLKLAEVDSVTVDVIIIPGFGVNSNFAKQLFFCDVDIAQKNVTFKSSYTASGGLSTDIRSFFNMLSQNKEMNDFYQTLAEFEDDKTSLKIDSIIHTELKPHRPFVFVITAKGNLEKSFAFINDSLMSLTLDDLILHNQVQSDEDSSDLNYYLDYCYTDHWQIILKFPCDVELLGYNGNIRELKNDFGSYTFLMNIVSNNQLVIQSSYKILKDMIPKENCARIKEMNAFVQEIKNMRVLIKLKT